MKYRKATAEIIYFDSEAFMTGSGEPSSDEPDCGHYGTIYDPRRGQQFTCLFVNFQGYDYNYNDYPKYTCTIVDPSVSGDLVCSIVNVKS